VSQGFAGWNCRAEPGYRMPTSCGCLEGLGWQDLRPAMLGHAPREYFTSAAFFCLDPATVPAREQQSVSQ
jgi:hypothetical protein